jgi:PAS domain S-box-containing protein
MRDQHRPKQDLLHELAALRKQVADLKEAMTARRRVEDALRASEQQVRTLIDTAPVGLCLFRPDGAAVAANRPFARLLGYDTSSELLRMTEALGVFGSREEQDRVLALVARAPEQVTGVLLRKKDGTRQPFGAVGAVSADPAAVVLVILKHPTPPWRAAPADAVSAGWPSGTRTA